MALVPLAAALLLWASPAPACLSGTEQKALLARVRAATLRLRANGSQGSGFFLKDPTSGGWLVTAHHVPENSKSPSGSGCRKTPAPPDIRTRFDLSRLKSDRRHFDFAVVPGRFDYGNDLVLTPATADATLDPAPAAAAPALGEEVLVAGFPATLGRYATLRCVMAGYAESLNDPANASYVLDCPDASYDIAGMSGGPIVSLCSGQVIGAVSWQDYDEDCPRRGDKRKVGAANLFADAAGKVSFGVPQAVHSRCWEYASDKLSKVKDCQVIPGYFNVTYGP